MTGRDPRTPISDEERIGYELKRIGDRLDALEAPSGTSIYQTVAKLQALIDDIQAQLDAWVAGRWDNDQITAQIYAIVAATLAGNVSIGGDLNVIGAVTMPGVRGTDLSAAPSRVAMWQAGPSDNRLGHT